MILRIVAMVVGFCTVLLFFFVPESFWDRTPHAKHRKSTISINVSKQSILLNRDSPQSTTTTSIGNSNRHDAKVQERRASTGSTLPQRPVIPHRGIGRSVGFATNNPGESNLGRQLDGAALESANSTTRNRAISSGFDPRIDLSPTKPPIPPQGLAYHRLQHLIQPAGGCPKTPILHDINSPYYMEAHNRVSDYVSVEAHNQDTDFISEDPTSIPENGDGSASTYDGETHHETTATEFEPNSKRYTNALRRGEKLSFTQQLKPYHGRLSNDSWFRVAIRPFILFAYPAVLWSSVVYACAVGWLIVLSESVSEIYRNADTYNFSALSTGLIYISPFLGGVLGTAVAGKVSDVIVKKMTKRNGGLYEPEFRLVMGIPITLTTVIGLMGYGWSAYEHDAWIVPTIFFGIISFGCSLASTTAITFCVDSYRQYAGEALVTLNFSKNIFHGLVFSLFFNNWLEAEGSRTVFIWLGVIQLIFMASTIPMYIFGKRARMWTVRMNLMERF
jgi:hypothetical protein